MKLIKSVSIFTLLFFVIIFLTGCNNKKVSIIFDTDGGSSVNDLIEIDLDNDFTLPVTEKDNFDFLGWYLDDELMNIELIRKYFIDNKEILSINLKAKWDIHSFKVKFYDGDLLLKEETVLYNESATAPELEEKIGYTFKRWDTIFTNVKSDIEVLAEWETNSHFVRYYDYDNTLLKEVPVEFNQELSSEIAPIANREGYDFIGWNKILPENMPDEDIVLIAEYDINQYSIFFVENGGSIVDTITDDYKTSVVKPVDPIKKGNKFIGWYLDSDFTESYVFSTIPSKDITLYAKWEINKYNLIYLNDDLNLIEQLSIEYNQDLSLINSSLPIKKGHEFIGWDQDLPSNMPDEDITLIAEFSINQYTIFFVENGGSTVDSIVQNYDTVVVKPTNPIKPGFIFVDWYLDADFINVYSFSKMTDEDIILYAKWEADESLIFEFEDYMLDKFSNYIEYDIVLPINYKGIDIVWTSSNSQVVSSSGQYFRPYIKTNLSLTANLEDENSIYTIVFDVIADGYKELKTGIASSYIYRQYANVTDDYFEILDIINCAFIKASSSGTLSGTTYLNNVSRYIIPKAKQNGVWVVMSIAPESSWSTIAASPTLVNTFANNIVNMINQYDFDGVDIDWETPTSGESESFVALAKTINEKVKANNSNHLVTAAVGGGMWQPPRYNLRDSVNYLDFINMMTYGMVSNNGYYQNALYPSSSFANSENSVGKTLVSCSIEESVAIYSTFDIPYEKIIVGAAFYGMKQTRTYDSANSTWSGWVSAGSVYYHSIVSNYYTDSNYTEYFDDVANVPYILKNDGTEFISYDNPRSIKAKCSYILNKKLGGMMFWESGTDTTNTLLISMGEGLGKI